MPKRDSIEFDLNNLPDTIEVEFENGVFDLTLQRNKLSGQLTIDIVSVDDDSHAIFGEPITYGVPLWYWCSYDWIPVERLIPFDEAGLESTVTLSKLQNSVFILDDDSIWEGGDNDGA